MSVMSIESVMREDHVRQELEEYESEHRLRLADIRSSVVCSSSGGSGAGSHRRDVLGGSRLVTVGGDGCVLGTWARRTI